MLFECCQRICNNRKIIGDDIELGDKEKGIDMGVAQMRYYSPNETESLIGPSFQNMKYQLNRICGGRNIDLASFYRILTNRFEKMVSISIFTLL